MTSECNFFGSPNYFLFCFRLHLKIPKFGLFFQGSAWAVRIKISKFWVPVSNGQGWARDGTGQSRDILSPSRLSHEYLSRSRQMLGFRCWVPLGTGYQANFRSWVPARKKILGTDGYQVSIHADPWMPHSRIASLLNKTDEVIVWKSN